MQGSRLIGKTIQQAGLRGLQDGFIVALQQGSKRVHAVSPDACLQAGDVVWLAGNGTSAVRQLRNIKGLEPQHQTVKRVRHPPPGPVDVTGSCFVFLSRFGSVHEQPGRVCCALAQDLCGHLAMMGCV